MKVSIQICACTHFAQRIYITKIDATLEPLRRRESQGYVHVHEEADKSMAYT